MPTATAPPPVQASAKAPAKASARPPAKTSAKPSTTVRVSERTHHNLRELAAGSGEPMQAVLDKAVEQYRRQAFFAECNAAYAALASDPEALAAEKAEFALFDGTLMDGLDPNEVWTEADFVPSGEGSKG